MASLFDSNRRAAAALGLPTWLLTGVAWVGFAFLAIGGMAGIPAFGVISGVFGAAILLIGVRALLAPPRAATTGNASMDAIFSTSRRIGAFYILVSAIWILMSVEVVLQR